MFHLLEQYEHGMIYRFHDDFSGEIIYEILPPDNFLIESRLGEAFNGSMIPRQLRESLLKSGAHYIANVYGEDNKVQCKGESMAAFDLSQLQMTAAPKTYIHSLSSLGVVSSVCFAIIVDQRLWGLFVFHNYGCTHQPSLRLRTACESIATTTSVRLEATAEKQKCARLRTLGEAMVNFKATKDTIRNLKDFGEEAVLRILDADLLVAHVQDAKSDEVETCVFGEKALAPTKELFSKLKDYPGRELLVASSTHEIQMQGLSEEASELSGLIYFREGRTQLLIGRANRSHYEWKRLSSESRGTVLKSSCKVWRNEDLLVCTAFKDEICRLAYEHMLLTIQADIEGTEAKYHLAVDRVRENYSFFAHMSHELRTPFHGVMGCLELLTNYSHQIRAMEAKDVIKTAITSGNHMM